MCNVVLLRGQFCSEITTKIQNTSLYSEHLSRGRKEGRRTEVEGGRGRGLEGVGETKTGRKRGREEERKNLSPESLEGSVPQAHPKGTSHCV